MENTTYSILLLILSYFVGSIPFTLIIGKLFKGVDIREHGSGNLGGTNAIRVLGVKYGLPAGAFDVLKAFIMVIIGAYVIELPFSPLYLGFAAALGHVYPIFANFKGGKAVSTLMGSYVAIHPVILLINVAIALLIIKLTKYVSLGSTVLAILLVLTLFIVPVEGEWIPRLLFMGLVLFKHRDNYKRLLQGKEHKAKM